MASLARDQQPLAAARTAQVQQRLERVLAALAAERVGTQHFASLTGYGHGDQGVRSWTGCLPESLVQKRLP